MNTTDKTKNRLSHLAELNAASTRNDLLTVYVDAASQHVLRMSFVPEDAAKRFDTEVVGFWSQLVQRDATSPLFRRPLNLSGQGVGSQLLPGVLGRQFSLVQQPNHQTPTPFLPPRHNSAPSFCNYRHTFAPVFLLKLPLVQPPAPNPPKRCLSNPFNCNFINNLLTATPPPHQQSHTHLSNLFTHWCPPPTAQ